MNYSDFEHQMQSRRDESRAYGDRYLTEQLPSGPRRPSLIGRLWAAVRSLGRRAPAPGPIVGRGLTPAAGEEQ